MAPLHSRLDIEHNFHYTTYKLTFSWTKIRIDPPVVKLAAPASPGESAQHPGRSYPGELVADQLPQHLWHATAHSRDRSLMERAATHWPGHYPYRGQCPTALAISHLVQADQALPPGYPQVFYFLVASQTFPMLLQSSLSRRAEEVPAKERSSKTQGRSGGIL